MPARSRITGSAQKKASQPEWRRRVVQLLSQRDRQGEDCGAPDGRIETDHVHAIKDGGALLDPAGFAHQKIKDERDAAPRNCKSRPALRGTAVSKPRCAIAERAQLRERSEA